MVSIYVSIEMNNSQDLFADQYILIVLLEITSCLPACRSRLINMVVIKGKNFEHLHGNLARKQHFPDQQKRKVDNSEI